MMNPKIKKHLIHFFLYGIIMALMWWAIDFADGKSFDLVKFLTRILIFGGAFALVLAILDARKSRKVEK
jgi:type IV secretory pathway TrbL component